MRLEYEPASEPLHITPEPPTLNTGNIAEMLLSADPKGRPSAAETRVSAPTPARACPSSLPRRIAHAPPLFLEESLTHLDMSDPSVASPSLRHLLPFTPTVAQRRFMRYIET